MTEPRVATSTYTGPLELLLYLCRRAEVDIHDLPVAEIAEQYVKELEAMQVLDLEYAGEFLSMAASLLKLKSDLVVARSEQGKQAEAERSRLVRQLLEYKRIRDLATMLGEAWDRQSMRHGRPGGLLGGDAPDTGNDAYLEQVTAIDLFRVFSRLYGEVAAPAPHLIELENRPVQYYVDLIVEQLRAEGKVDFSRLVGAHRRKPDVIGNFLALLEMVKQHQVEIAQRDDGEIEVSAPRPQPDA
jgi:segregation and condensation protein A